MEDYEQILRPIQPQMIRTVWRVLGDGNDADEALQQALIKIWKSWPSLLRHPNPQALALRICGDCAYDELRRRFRRFRQPSLTGDELTTRPEPPEQMRQAESYLAIMQAIARLPRNQAVAFVMRAIQDQSYRQIADALGCAEATARKHVERARNSLSKKLASHVPDAKRSF